MSKKPNTSSFKTTCVRCLTFGCLPSKKKHIAVIRLSGVIADGGLIKKGLSLEVVEDQIEKAFEASNIAAVALQINSPGGSPVQSELIFKTIRRLSEKKDVPVYTFVEDLAASGGYWLACAADEIYCSKTSIVGSIGVISSGFGFVQAIKKIGVERRVHTQGKNKSVLDPFLPEKQEDIEILNKLQKDAHDSFIEMVKERREGKIQENQYDEIFTGEFWSGVRALDFGLVDGIGDMHGVLKDKFGDNIKFHRVSKPKGFLQKKLGMSSLGHRESSAVEAFIETAWSSLEERLMWMRYR